MAITLPFQDTFSTGSDIDTGVYTKLSAQTYLVSGGVARVSENAGGGAIEIEGFHTTDTVSGDFQVTWATQQKHVSNGTQHECMLYIDASNFISVLRYESGGSWFNPRFRKVVAGTPTNLFDDTTSNGDTDTTLTNIWYRIKKIGQVFTLYTSRDGSSYTQRYSGTISDWASNQVWKIGQRSLNNWDTSTFNLDQLDIISMAVASGDNFQMGAEM